MKIPKFFVSIGAVVLLLAAGEIGLRLFWEMSPSVRRAFYQRSNDPFIRYELIPNTVVSGRIRINSGGFRGPEVTIEKPKGVFRILMLGDSEIFSYLLPEDAPLPRQLEKLLNEESRNLKYEVINAGVEGYNTLQELEVLKYKGLKYSPDLVILNYVLNDPEPGEYFFGDNFFARNSATYRYFMNRVKKAMIKANRKKLGIKTEVDEFYYLHSGARLRNVQNAIIEMADILRKRNIKLIVNIFPTSSLSVKDFKENYPYRPLHALIKSIKDDNIIFVDQIDEFNRLGMTPQGVSINYQYNESHKNGAASAVMAEYLYRVLFGPDPKVK